MRTNILLNTDSYKLSHPMQYGEGVTHVGSYVESRGGRYGSTVFFGLQYWLKEYLGLPFIQADINEAAAFAQAHGEPFPKAEWEVILKRYGGYMPVKIRAVAEGSVVPTHNALAIIESTDPDFPWIVSWLETSLLRAIWYPTTVATKSYYCKKVLLEALIKSSDDPAGELPFKLHDFGARGASSHESAAIGGAAHLVNFKGSDTIEGVRLANHYYNEAISGFSIPASEHSTMTIRGREGELGQMRRMIQQFGKPGATLACVSDSYDLFHAVEHFWCDELLEDVKASGATVVIRPDSGDPSEVNLKLLQILERKVGMRTNMKGYKVLPAYFRLIQGDGNDNEESIAKVLHTLMQHGYSASNIAFGMGGGLLQKVDRDTQKFALKCSEATINGQEVEVYKDPITDPGKKSKRGRLDLVFRDGQFKTVSGDQGDSVLHTVYENGKMGKTYTLAEVRKNAEKGMF